MCRRVEPTASDLRGCADLVAFVEPRGTRLHRLLGEWLGELASVSAARRFYTTRTIRHGRAGGSR